MIFPNHYENRNDFFFLVFLKTQMILAIGNHPTIRYKRRVQLKWRLVTRWKNFNTETVSRDSTHLNLPMSFIGRIHQLGNHPRINSQHPYQNLQNLWCKFINSTDQKKLFFQRWWCLICGRKSGLSSTTDGWCLCVQCGCSHGPGSGTCLGAFRRW